MSNIELELTYFEQAENDPQVINARKKIIDDPKIQLLLNQARDHLAFMNTEFIKPS